MSENYIVINGKKMDLTEEQLKQLGIEVRKNPFERACKGKGYFYIGRFDDPCEFIEFDTVIDRDLSVAANYFNDEAFAKQVALHQLLYRKLLKFSYDNECGDEEWNGNNMHAYIIYSFMNKDYDIRWTCDDKKQGTVYFKSTAWATAALNEVVMPFVKEHPEFVW